MKWHYFLGDRIIIKAFYRYFRDFFGIEANTFNIETPLKITNFISFSPFYRIHNQIASRYFAPYKAHDPSAEYYTSDYDLSSYTSHFIGAGFTYSPALAIGKFKLSKKTKKDFIFKEIQVRGGSYYRTDGMRSMLVSLGLSFAH